MAYDTLKHSMIGYLKGITIGINPVEKTLLILTGQVGYRVSVSTEVLSRAKIESPLELFIHTAVREDDISLYGFEHHEEYTFFKQLIEVSGIGPKMGLEILASPIHITQNAIVGGDIDLLTKIKGIGKKTAERMALELKGKIIPTGLGGISQKGESHEDDAVLALTSLGYEKFQVIKVLTTAPTAIKTTEEKVKFFLKQAS